MLLGSQRVLSGGLCFCSFLYLGAVSPTPVRQPQRGGGFFEGLAVYSSMVWGTAAPLVGCLPAARQRRHADSLGIGSRSPLLFTFASESDVAESGLPQHSQLQRHLLKETWP